MEGRGAQNIHSLDGTSHTTPSYMTAGSVFNPGVHLPRLPEAESRDLIVAR